MRFKRRFKKKDPWLTQPRATVIAAVIAGLTAIIVALINKG